MATPIERVLKRLCDVEATGKDSWKALCPAHDDHTPSLSIDIDRYKTHKILIHCHAACDFQDIIDELDLRVADLDTHYQGRVIEQIYDYVDEDGDCIHQTVRLTGKKFRQRRPDPNNPNGYIWRLQGIEPILYNLPDVLDSDDEWVYLCEGEKSADAIISLGLISTCNAMGAGKWKANYTKTLTGKKVCILPDDDAAGLKHTIKVGNALLGKAADVRVVYFYDDNNSGGDPWDWVAEDGNKKELLDLTSAASTYERVEMEDDEQAADEIINWELHTLKDAYREREPRKYWVDGIFIDASLNIIYGKPEALKSMLMLDCALCVAGGAEWLAPETKAPELPGGRASKIMQDILAGQGIIVAKQTTQVPVMWMDFDDGIYLTEERTEAIARYKYGKAAPDLPFYYVSYPRPVMRANDMELIGGMAKLLKDKGIKMLFVGNLGTTSGGAKENTDDMIEVMANWRWLAEDAKAAIVIVAHPRKGDDVGSESLRGHSSIMASLDLALYANRSDNVITIQSTKSRGAPVDTFGAKWWFEHKANSRELLYAGFYGVKVDTKRSRTMEACLDIVNAHPDTSTDAIAKLVKSDVEADEKYTVSIKYIKGIMTSMAKDGKLRKVDLGRDNAKGYEVIS